MKEKTYKEQKTEATRGKKRFLERLAETRDADKEIDNYLKEDEFGFDEREQLTNYK